MKEYYTYRKTPPKKVKRKEKEYEKQKILQINEKLRCKNKIIVGMETSSEDSDAVLRSRKISYFVIFVYRLRFFRLGHSTVEAPMRKRIKNKKNER